MFFIPFGMLTQGAIGLDSVTMAGMVQNIVLATVGNIVGGALMPPLQGMIIDCGTVMGHPAVNVSYVLPLLCFVIVTIYGIRSRR